MDLSNLEIAADAETEIVEATKARNKRHRRGNIGRYAKKGQKKRPKKCVPIAYQPTGQVMDTLAQITERLLSSKPIVADAVIVLLNVIAEHYAFGNGTKQLLRRIEKIEKKRITPSEPCTHHVHFGHTTQVGHEEDPGFENAVRIYEETSQAI